jgi:hypothetical protein
VWFEATGPLGVEHWMGKSEEILWYGWMGVWSSVLGCLFGCWSLLFTSLLVAWVLGLSWFVIVTWSITGCHGYLVHQGLSSLLLHQGFTMEWSSHYFTCSSYFINHIMSYLPFPRLARCLSRACLPSRLPASHAHRYVTSTHPYPHATPSHPPNTATHPPSQKPHHSVAANTPNARKHPPSTQPTTLVARTCITQYQKNPDTHAHRTLANKARTVVAVLYSHDIPTYRVAK